MYRLWLVLLMVGMIGCAAPHWTWQDTRKPGRTSADGDLAACRSYASSQYSPGTPSGDPYLIDQLTPRPFIDENPDNPLGTGIWHSDREPFPYANRNGGSLHGVVVPYTGYPGELDYHPEYLDALVEKCMADRGWVYRPPEVAK